MPPKSRKADQPATVELRHRDPNHAAGTVFVSTPRELNDLVAGAGYRIADGRSLAAATRDLAAANVPADAEPGAEPKTQTTTTQTTGGTAS